MIRFGGNFGRNFVIFVKHLLASHFSSFLFFYILYKCSIPIISPIRTSTQPKVFILKQVPRARLFKSVVYGMYSRIYFQVAVMFIIGVISLINRNRIKYNCMDLLKYANISISAITHTHIHTQIYSMCGASKKRENNLIMLKP